MVIGYGNLFYYPPEVTPGHSRKIILKTGPCFGSTLKPWDHPSTAASFFYPILGVYPERRRQRAGCDFTELDTLKREPRSTLTFPAHLTANPRRNIYRKEGWNRLRPAPVRLKSVGAGVNSMLVFDRFSLRRPRLYLQVKNWSLSLKEILQKKIIIRKKKKLFRRISEVRMQFRSFYIFIFYSSLLLFISATAVSRLRLPLFILMGPKQQRAKRSRNSYNVVVSTQSWTPLVPTCC